MAAIEEFLADCTRRMDGTIEHTRTEFNSVRTGRASTALLDRITIDYYGTPTPLSNMATISAPEARFLPELTHLEAIERGLRVMDTTALSLCMDNGVSIHVFELADGNIARAARGERIGTLVTTAAGASDDG